MIKRNAFIASILGMAGISKIARAQQWKECADPASNTVARLSACTTKPFLNNQCPVCGTMATPFSIKQEQPLVTPRWKQLADCARCRNAFWQDSEG